jgi:hypothetical protein
MRSALHRLLLACGLAAVAAVCLPSIASAAAPQGSLTVAEYEVLLATYQRSEALEHDRTPTTEELNASCEPLAARPTALISAVHGWCQGALRLTESFNDKGCGSKDTRCAARELLEVENATRSMARLSRAVRRTVADRGLAGQCARAFNGPPEAVTFWEAFANAVRDLRRAVISGSDRMLRRATVRLQRASRVAQDIEDDDSAALLATCPRV